MGSDYPDEASNSPERPSGTVQDPAPAIRTRYDGRYDDVERIKTVGKDVRFIRGLGETGTRVDLIDASAIGGCPRCETDEMVASVDLNPGHEYDRVVLYCTNVACPHFVADAVEYDMDRIRADTPHVWDNSAECPECERRHTVQITRGDRLHDEANAGTSCIVHVLCDRCEAHMTSEVEA